MLRSPYAAEEAERCMRISLRMSPKKSDEEKRYEAELERIRTMAVQLSEEDLVKLLESQNSRKA